MTVDAPPWLDYAAAARRTNSSTRTIKRWRRTGMPMTWRVGADGQRERVVREDVLLAWWRDRMRNSPVHYYRMRALTREQGLPDAVRHPATLKRTPAPPTLSDGEGAQIGAEPSMPRRVDPLADMAPLRGEPEFNALREALRHETAGCAGIDAFTADRVDDETAVVLASICAACPVQAVCAAFGDVGRPAAGYWGNRTAERTFHVARLPRFQ